MNCIDPAQGEWVLFWLTLVARDGDRGFAYKFVWTL